MACTSDACTPDLISLLVLLPIPLLVPQISADSKIASKLVRIRANLEQQISRFCF
jgi:hypothetical protein